MHRDPWERIVCASSAGIYESNYLKANSPDGQWGLWIKHNLLRPPTGEGVAEFWIVLSRRGHSPLVAKKETPLHKVRINPQMIEIDSDAVRLSTKRANGRIADIQWDLHLSDADPALHHYPWDWMYGAGFPKKKVITPAPHLRFSGTISVAGTQLVVDQWEGLRGHNWGKEHAWRYAYGNCHLWNDGQRRTFDAFSAQIRLPGGVRSPWLSSVIARHPNHCFNGPGNWLKPVKITATSWNLRGKQYHLSMTASADQMVGLRYAHPNGDQSFCYNTKFADVQWLVGDASFESDKGEFESLFPNPVADIPLHPAPAWDQSQGDYRCE